MHVNVCVPVLRRYDLLGEMLDSLSFSTVEHDVWIIDNGRNEGALTRAIAHARNPTAHVLTPHTPLGVASSWNWFLENVPEERLITNDDVLFAPESLALMSGAPGELVTAIPSNLGSAFPCFVIRDECVRRVGLFDETISPGYGYYEDCDYENRLELAGIKIMHVDCGVVHRVSSTLAASTADELQEHHRRFKIAQGNYVAKWNRPGHPRNAWFMRMLPHLVQR